MALKNIDIVVGTRPEIIKVASIIWELEERDLSYRLIHTGQHYSSELSQVFFEELNIDEPDFNLEVGSLPENQQIARGLEKIDTLWNYTYEPNHVLVQGDTNSTLVGGLAARKRRISVSHVEAGLRSGNEEMSEEMNRRTLDHISQTLFPPTEMAAENLYSEGLPSERIRVTGNTIVDAVQFIVSEGQENKIQSLLEDLGIYEEEYIVFTCHRAENVDEEERFHELIEGILDAVDDSVVYPMHPRVRANVSDEYLDWLEQKMIVIEPLPYMDFIRLLSNAKACITDSGGIQEETATLDVPCFTVRDQTERPESLEAGSNILLGTEKSDIFEGLSKHLSPERLQKMRDVENPYGDGNAAVKIVDTILKQ